MFVLTQYNALPSFQPYGLGQLTGARFDLALYPDSNWLSTFSRIDGCIAVVESIPAIVLDIESTLRNFGARQVLAVGSPHQTGELLGHPQLAAAIIDTCFGDTVGIALANDLRRFGIPLVFLNADPSFEPSGALEGVVVIAKPHGERELVDALLAALQARENRVGG